MSEQPGPFRNDPPVPDEDYDAFLARLDAAGVRLMPHPFASALSIASDVDGSDRFKSRRYIDVLTREMGLDFGDSCWLRWQYNENALQPRGLGVFSHRYDRGQCETASDLVLTRSFNETVDLFAAGDVDHFHSFLPYGPRGILLHDPEPVAGGIRFRLDAPANRGRWSCADFPIVGVAIITDSDRAPAVENILLGDLSGEVHDLPYDATESLPLGKGFQHMFLHIGDADRPARFLLATQCRELIVRLRSEFQPGASVRACLLNTSGPLLLDRLRLLRREYGLQPSLITEHSGLHFRNPGPTRKADEMMKQAHAASGGAALSANGRLETPDGELLFSSDSDDPESFARVLPELSRELEFRYFVPAPAQSDRGWRVPDLVVPSPTRSGGGIYWARRCRPMPGGADDVVSRQDTVSARIDLALDEAARDPGRIWPIYTHLGGWDPAGPTGERIRASLDDPDDARPMPERRRVPEPYFDMRVIRRLRDAHFGRSPDPVSERVWFGRTTVHYDYALALRHIADNVSRSTDGAIRVSSWTDRCLGRKHPLSAGMLFGLTFHVDDPKSARVELDGHEIRDVSRNAADGANRASVSILACDVSIPLPERADPVCGNGDWSWTSKPDDLPSRGRLALGATGPARAKWSFTPPLDVHAAQSIAWDIRRSSGARFALRYRTAEGGLFSILESGMEASAGVRASYRLRPDVHGPFDGGGPRRIAVPLYDLDWVETGHADDVLPNHPIRELELLAQGKAGEWVEFGDCRFLRPRGLAPDPAGLVTVSGRAEGSPLPPAVGLFRGADPRPARFSEVDVLGAFCVTGVARGVYRLAPADAEGRRLGGGRRIEVDGPRFGLVVG